MKASENALYERNPATLVYYPEDTTHGEEHFIDGRHFLVEIAPVFLERMRGYGARLDEPFSMGTDSALWLASRMYREFSARDAFASLVLESMASELLVATTRALSPTIERNAPGWLGSAKEYLAQNFVEPPGLRELARAVSVHPSHLARVFRRFELCTPGEYIRRLRVSRSQALLADGHTPMVEIAHAVGFSDQSHFTRSFRIETGMTPRQYRDMFTRH